MAPALPGVHWMKYVFPATCLRLGSGLSTVNVPAARAVEDISTNRAGTSIADRRTALAIRRFMPICYLYVTVSNKNRGFQKIPESFP
ncbi:uncharacterized protein METZ01_LOCUS335680, partial [marine metagenome]